MYGRAICIQCETFESKRELKRNEENRLLLHMPHVSCLMLLCVICRCLFLWWGNSWSCYVRLYFVCHPYKRSALLRIVYTVLPCWWWLVQRAAAIYTLVLIKVCAIHVVCDPCMTIVESHFKCLFGKLTYIFLSFIAYWELRIASTSTVTTNTTIKTTTEQIKRI